MKAFTFLYIFAAFGLSNSGLGQISPADQTTRPGNSFIAEWKGGAQGALVSAGICAGGFLLTRIISVWNDSNTTDNEGFGPGLLPIMFSLASVPFLVSWGISRSGTKFNPNGQYWHALAGSLIGVAVSIPINSLIYTLTTSATTPMLVYIAPFILDPFVIIPIASVIAYNLLGRCHSNPGSCALLNFRRGAFNMGTPLPVIYPTRFTGGKICSGISLLKISF